MDKCLDFKLLSQVRIFLLRFFLLTLICSICSSKYGVSLDIFSFRGGVVIVGASVDGFSEVRVISSFPVSFYESLFVVSFNSLVSSDRGTIYYPIFFIFLCFFPIN